MKRLVAFVLSLILCSFASFSALGKDVLSEGFWLLSGIYSGSSFTTVPGTDIDHSYSVSFSVNGSGVITGSSVGTVSFTGSGYSNLYSDFDIVDFQPAFAPVGYFSGYYSITQDNGHFTCHDVSATTGTASPVVDVVYNYKYFPFFDVSDSTAFSYSYIGSNQRFALSISKPVSFRFLSRNVSPVLTPAYGHTYLFSVVGLNLNRLSVSFGSQFDNTAFLDVLTDANSQKLYRIYGKENAAAFYPLLTFSGSGTSTVYDISLIDEGTGLVDQRNTQDYLEGGFSAGVNDQQSIVDGQINSGITQMDVFEQGVYADINQYKSGLDFSMASFNEAASGLDYIRGIFMMIWNNSPVSPIILSMMLGLVLLLIGRGAKAAVSSSDTKVEKTDHGLRQK